IAVAILKFSGGDERIMALFITQWKVNGGYVEWIKGLPEIFHGQVWRLFTPMFIHFGFVHIFFNMLWLRDLGSMIESRESSSRLIFLVLLAAGGSNFAQYAITIPAFPALSGGSPSFGGMSGVIYGLLGYIWVRGKLDPASGLILQKFTVTMMLAWLVLCMTGLLGSIANLAHFFGLLIGMGCGFVASQFRGHLKS
ncbi:MAG: rhomboid family intramembrane serine protease, partial [Verrucomicrobiota bacterium]